MDLPYQEYFDALPCYLSVQDCDFRILRANRRFIEDFGDPGDGLCYQVYKHRSERCDLCPVAHTFRDGKGHTSEEHVRTLEGREISVLVNTTPIRDASGKITSVLEMSTDITPIKILQAQLKQSRRRYHLLFDEVPCFISIQDRDLRVVESNRRFREAFGEHYGCKCYEVYKHRQEECTPCAVQATFRDGEVHHSEEVVTSREGKQINTLVYSAPIPDGDGAVTRVMEMSADITPIRELQSQLEGIGLLISSVSHGVKGLLNGLDGGMYLLTTGIEKGDPKRQGQGLEMVRRNVDRIRAQVMNILYYARERVPNWEMVRAAELAEEVREICASRAGELDIELHSSLSESVGELEADPQALRSLLVNLVENSLDACRVDLKKDRHRVSLRIEGREEQVVFEIEDNGIGMDRETREKAFSLFFTSKGVKGTGLGLFIANKIATAHGGSIELDSELDRGTRLSVILPRARPAQPDAGDQPEPIQESADR